MTTEQVVETAVTVNNKSPIQDYVHPDDETQPTFEMTPGFKPFTVLSLGWNFSLSSGPLYLMLFFSVGSNAHALQTLPSSELGCKTRFIS